MPAPLDPARVTAIDAALTARDGRSRAQLGRDFGVHPRTIQRRADALGLTGLWDTTGTRKATESARDRMKAQRAILAQRALDEAGLCLDQLHRPFLVFNFGGKDNTYEERTLPGPPTGDIRNLMTSFAVAVDKHVVLDRHDAADNHADTAGVLAQLADELAAAARPPATPIEEAL